MTQNSEVIKTLKRFNINFKCLHNKQHYKQSQMQKKLFFHIKDKRMTSPNIKKSTTRVFFKKEQKPNIKIDKEKNSKGNKSLQKEL